MKMFRPIAKCSCFSTLPLGMTNKTILGFVLFVDLLSCRHHLFQEFEVFSCETPFKLRLRAWSLALKMEIFALSALFKLLFMILILNLFLVMNAMYSLSFNGHTAYCSTRNRLAPSSFELLPIVSIECCWLMNNVCFFVLHDIIAASCCFHKTLYSSVLDLFYNSNRICTGLYTLTPLGKV